METLCDIIRLRTAPGILIFDLDLRLLFANPEALEMLNLHDGHSVTDRAVPGEIWRICSRLKETGEADTTSPPSLLAVGAGPPCSLRAFLLPTPGEGRIMVLMERVVEKHQVDIDKARRQFQLSKREAEVVRFLCQGLANRDISETLFISEYTVKDHIKSVMKKMEAGSRNEIISLLR